MEPTRRLSDRDVFPIGVGGASWSLTTMSEPAAAAVLHEALSAGIDVIDTAPAYTRAGSPHHNETLIGDVLTISDADPFLVTKGGHRRTSGNRWVVQADADALRRDCLGSLKALQRASIDLYLLHWPDPDVPLHESVAALRDLQQDGLVTAIGLSNVTVQQLELALQIAPIAAVENRYSMLSRDDEPMIAATRERGIAYLAYSPLGGAGALADLHQLEVIAQQLDHPLPRLLLARLIRHAPHCIPLVGAGSLRSVREAVAAASVVLTDAQWAQFDDELETQLHPSDRTIPRNR